MQEFLWNLLLDRLRQYLNSGFHSKTQKSPEMKFIHILVVIFVTLIQTVHCHKKHHARISSQMHLNAMEYIMAGDLTKRFEKKSEITATKKTKKKVFMRQVRDRQRWHYYDLFLL